MWFCLPNRFRLLMQLNTVIDVTVHFLSALISKVYITAWKRIKKFRFCGKSVLKKNFYAITIRDCMQNETLKLLNIESNSARQKFFEIAKTVIRCVMLETKFFLFI